MLEELHDLYPKTNLFACIVAPFESGDTPLQHYNSVLSLATAADVADAVVLFANDDLMRRATRRVGQAGGGGTAPRLAMGDVNAVAAGALSCLLGAATPAAGGRARAPPSAHWPDMRGDGRDRFAAVEEEEEHEGEAGAPRFDGSAVLESLIPFPALKFLDLRGVTSAPPRGVAKQPAVAPMVGWPGLADELCDGAVKAWRPGSPVRSVRTRLFAYGPRSEPPVAKGGRPRPPSQPGWAGLPNGEDWDTGWVRGYDPGSLLGGVGRQTVGRVRITTQTTNPRAPIYTIHNALSSPVT